MASDGPPNKIALFTTMLMIGLVLSQVLPAILDHHTHELVEKVTEVLTMFCLSFLMVHVGYELDIDKSRWRDYGYDYVIAMLAAGLPWILVSTWFHFAMPDKMDWSSALLLGRFAAPTSAGILFAMLEAAGLKQTWLYQKARILAILDDLDTILLMIPLKVMIVGFRFKLLGDATIVIGLLCLAWAKLHEVALPSTWNWTMVYAAVVTVFCMLVHYVTHGQIQLEVLLPAFTVGCITKISHHQEGKKAQEKTNNVVVECVREVSCGETSVEKFEEAIQTGVSTVFMLLVGLSMPSLFIDGEKDGMRGFEIIVHVLVVSLLMILGKMFVCLCYSDEANFNERLGLGFGMCPRGEVGAGVIVISLSLGIKGPAITVAVICLAVNLVLSSGFIFAVRQLLTSKSKAVPKPGKPRRSWLFFSILVLVVAMTGRRLLQGSQLAATSLVPKPYFLDQRLLPRAT